MEQDAILAVNVLNCREIAQNYVTAQIENNNGMLTSTPNSKKIASKRWNQPDSDSDSCNNNSSKFFKTNFDKLTKIKCL